MHQLSKSVQNGWNRYAADTGTANAAVITLSPAVTALTSGMVFRIKKMNATNSGAMTLAVNGLTARAIVKMGGTAMAASDLVANYPFEVMYDSVLNVFVVVNFPGTAVGSDISGQITTAINNYITVAPFSDISVFTAGSGSFVAPSAVYTKAPFTGATVGAAANVILSSGSCKILVPGRYFVTTTAICGVNPAVYNVFSQYPSAVLKNSSIYSNGSGFALDNSLTGLRVKEVSGSNVFIGDFLANDILDAAIYQASNGSASATMTTSVQFTITKVH